ncbi:hypothetical protein JYU19_00445, partial [bacterium AH-315-J21]|nr:hypothetical protein [bacterium AH-315-J21]
MIKRILVAVAITLLVPFIFLLGATQAFADLPTGKRAAQPLPSINPAAPLFGQDDAQPMAREILQKLAVPYVIIDMSGVDLSKNYVPTFTCVDQDNTDYASGFGTFTFFDNGAAGGVVPRTGNIYFVQDNFLCSLTGTWLYFNDLVGDIDGEIGIWTSAGGIPTAQVGSVIINSVTTGLGWNFYDLSGLGLTFTDDFAVTFGTVLGSAVDPLDDKMQCLVDAAGSAGTTPRTGVSYWV